MRAAQRGQRDVLVSLRGVAVDNSLRSSPTANDNSRESPFIFEYNNDPLPFDMNGTHKEEEKVNFGEGEWEDKQVVPLGEAEKNLPGTLNKIGHTVSRAVNNLRVHHKCTRDNISDLWNEVKEMYRCLSFVFQLLEDQRHMSDVQRSSDGIAATGGKPTSRRENTFALRSGITGFSSKFHPNMTGPQDMAMLYLNHQGMQAPFGPGPPFAGHDIASPPPDNQGMQFLNRNEHGYSFSGQQVPGHPVGTHITDFAV